jgi:hypothetical protein
VGERADATITLPSGERVEIFDKQLGAIFGDLQHERETMLAAIRGLLDKKPDAEASARKLLRHHER